jgi:hypothetical protein
MRLGHRGRASSLTAAVLVAAVAAVSAPGTAQAQTVARGPSGLQKSAITLSGAAGFAHINQSKLHQTTPVGMVQMTPTLAIKLQPSTTTAFTDGNVTINGRATDGTVTIAKLGGFAIVTDRHANLTYRYKTALSPGMTLVQSADGGIDERTTTGTVVAHIGAAFAIDSAGAKLPAAYTYDARKGELVVTADTRLAHGATLIDPSWRCWATASAIGLSWVVAAAAFVFTDGGAAWVAWALRVWFGLSYNAADTIARACALH